MDQDQMIVKEYIYVIKYLNEKIMDVSILEWLFLTTINYLY